MHRFAVVRAFLRLAVMLAVCSLFVTAACSSTPEEQCIPGTEHCSPVGDHSTVVVVGAGTGSGRILNSLLPFPPSNPASSDLGIDCDVGVSNPTHTTCQDDFVPVVRNPASNQYVQLEAIANSGSVFAGWFSGCSEIVNIGLGIGNGCVIQYSSAGVGITYTVTARFNLVTATTCSNPVVIQDQFDSDAGWTATATTSGGSPTQSVTFQAAGGNPGGYRQMQHVFAGASAIAVYHSYGTTTYNPGTQGAIDHINYTEDQIELNPPSPGAAVGTGFSMVQGGTRYNIILRPPAGAFTNTTWETTSRVNLSAADFSGVNFSATGGPITFGYFRSNTNTGGGAATMTHGIDNWKVEICR